MKIKKVKDTFQRNQQLEEENKYIQKKLLENIEKNGHVKKRKQDLINQIQKLKDDEKSHE